MKKIQFKLCGDLKIKEFCVSLFRGQVFFLLTLFLKTGINTLPSSLTIMIQFFKFKRSRNSGGGFSASFTCARQELKKH